MGIYHTMSYMLVGRTREASGTIQVLLPYLLGDQLYISCNQILESYQI